MLRAYMSEAALDKVLGTDHLEASRVGENWVVSVPMRIPRQVPGRVIVYAGGGTPSLTLSARDARVIDLRFMR